MTDTGWTESSWPARYRFTADTTGNLRRYGPAAFREFAGRATRYLEVGVFEGMSACWFFDNVLTDPASYTYLVDERPWSVPAPNLRLHDPAKYQYRKGCSSVAVPLLVFRTFDLIYVDGDHREGPAYRDVTNCWGRLAPGGLLAVDDYELTESSLDPTVKFGVGPAVDRFLAGLPADSYRVEHRAWEVVIRRLR